MPKPVGPGGPSSSSSQPNDQNVRQMFPSMPMTKKQYDKFMQTEFKFISQIVKHDMERMKKALKKLKEDSG